MPRPTKRIVRLMKNLSILLGGNADLEATFSITHRKFRAGDMDDFVKFVEREECLEALDLGCGAKPHNFFGVASIHGMDFLPNGAENVEGVDLSAGLIPRQSDSIDLVTSFDFVEHLPRWERTEGIVRFPFVEFINEVHRILRPGGLFFSKTPAFPSGKAFQDPTHTNFITEETFPKYFCGPTMARPYGFAGKFELVEQVWNGGHLLTMLQKSRAELH